MDETLVRPRHLTPAQRRDLGSFYTPSPVVAYMAAACLPVKSRQKPRVLDPACGDGRFLWGVAERLSGQRNLSARERLKLIRTHVHGVDIDRAAIAEARRRLLAWISPEGPQDVAEAESVLAANLRTGHALIGEDFAPAGGAAGFSWRDAFPQIARDGGFDVVLGNPPYRRELDAKGLFDEIAASPLGQKWRQSRMDLWYYFLHRGLDLLKPGGVLSFIVNSYWTASRGAARLIARLEQETNLDEVVLLGDRKIFSDVQGRHLIFRLQKTPRRRPCRVIVATDPETDIRHEAERYTLPQSQLYSSGRLTFARPLEHAALFENCRPLGQAYETSQGLAENPPRVNRGIAAQLGGEVEIGAGVFVLTDDEVARLELNAAERQLLRPYYLTAALDRYVIPARPTHALLYLTRETAPSLDGLPNIARHLSRYRTVLDQRRETRMGRIAWWHLHWPRREAAFTGEKILSIQMGRAPRFAYAAQPAFVGFSVNLIRSGGEGCSLAALNGILNSGIAATWFARHAKQRGANVEINLHVLRQFPLPSRNVCGERALTECVVRRQAESDPARIAELDARIEAQVRSLYEKTAVDQGSTAVHA